VRLWFIGNDASSKENHCDIFASIKAGHCKIQIRPQGGQNRPRVLATGVESARANELSLSRVPDNG
jgi:hypothetical protein